MSRPRIVPVTGKPPGGAIKLALIGILLVILSQLLLYAFIYYPRLLGPVAWLFFPMLTLMFFGGILVFIKGLARPIEAYKARKRIEEFIDKTRSIRVEDGRLRLPGRHRVSYGYVIVRQYMTSKPVKTRRGGKRVQEEIYTVVHKAEFREEESVEDETVDLEKMMRRGYILTAKGHGATSRGYLYAPGVMLSGGYLDGLILVFMGPSFTDNAAAKISLEAGKSGEHAVFTGTVEGARITGVLTANLAKARAARLELHSFSSRVVRIGKTDTSKLMENVEVTLRLAETRTTTNVEKTLDLDRDVVLASRKKMLRIENIVDALGLETPVVLGLGGGDNWLRLVIDMPMRRDIVAEQRIEKKPVEE